jgi:hypothetical protein
MKSSIKSSIGILAPLALLLASAANAAGGSHIRAPEAAIEIRLSAVNLPDRLGGQIMLAPCPTCAPRAFGIAPDALLQWNGVAVTLQTLRQRALKGSTAAATLVYTRDNNRIVRILVND